MIDAPTGITNTTPTFLIGGDANVSQPSKAAVGAAGRSILASTDAAGVLSAADLQQFTVEGLPAAVALGPNDLIAVSQGGNTRAAKARSMLPTSEVVVGTGLITVNGGTGFDYIVTGAGTLFTTEVKAGDLFTVSGNQSTVIRVISDTVLWLSTWLSNAAGIPFNIERSCASSFTTALRFVSLGGGGSLLTVCDDRSNPVIETLSCHATQSRSNIRATCAYPSSTTGGSATSPIQQAFGANTIGLRYSTWVCWANGAHGWGPGTASRDVFLGRSATAKELEVGADVVPALGSTDGGTGITFIKGIQKRRSTGANAMVGEAVLVGGTVTVSTSAITANSSVFLTRQAGGGTLGHLSVSAKNVGTSFVITSNSATDTSTVAWEIIERA